MLLYFRPKQHKKVAGEGASSAVHNHLIESDHEFNNDKVKISCKEKNLFERGLFLPRGYLHKGTKPIAQQTWRGKIQIVVCFGRK